MAVRSRRSGAVSGASGPTPKVRTGEYYGSDTLLTTGNFSANGSLRLSPLWVPTATFDRIACEVTTAGAATSLARLAIYASHATTGYPTSLVLDAGTVATDSTGVKEATVSQALTAGLYWVGLAPQGGVTVPTFRVNANMTPRPMGTTSPGNNHIVGYEQTGVTGAMPASFSDGAAGTTSVPRVWLRAA